MVVPEPLRRFVGKRELIESLKTSNFSEAKRLFPARVHNANKVIEVARFRADAKRNWPKGRPLPLSEVMFPDQMGGRPAEWAPSEIPRLLVLESEQDAQEIARQYFLEIEREGARQWSEIRGDLSRQEFEEMRAELSDTRESLEENQESKRLHASYYEDGSRLLRDYLVKHNLKLRKESPDFATLARLFRDASIEHVRRQEDRINGEPFRAYSALFADLTERTLATPTQARFTLGFLCDRFLDEKQKARAAEKTIFQHRTAAGLLLNFLTRTDWPVRLRGWMRNAFARFSKRCLRTGGSVIRSFRFTRQ